MKSTNKNDNAYQSHTHDDIPVVARGEIKQIATGEVIDILNVITTQQRENLTVYRNKLIDLGVYDPEPEVDSDEKISSPNNFLQHIGMLLSEIKSNTNHIKNLNDNFAKFI